MEIFLDALKDSALVLPFLVAIYIVMEIVEENFSDGFTRSSILKKKYAPALGVAAGVVPQCGFSVVATELYNKKIITVGTLLAVYISTSDEAIPILLSDVQSALKLLPLLGIKLVFALAAGFGVDFAIRLINKRKKIDMSTTSVLPADKAAPKQNDISSESDEGAVVSTGKSALQDNTLSETKKEKRARIWAEMKKKLPKCLLNALLRSAKIFLYIFIINLAFGFIVEKVGMERLEAFLVGSKYYQPFLAALVGAIPNCASSVLLAEMYSMDLIGLGSAVAGLSMNAGIGFTVLFKNRSELKHNLLIFFGLYLASAVLGLLIGLIW